MCIRDREIIHHLAKGDQQQQLEQAISALLQYTETPDTICLKNSIAEALSAEGNYCF